LGEPVVPGGAGDSGRRLLGGHPSARSSPQGPSDQTAEEPTTSGNVVTTTTAEGVGFEPTRTLGYLADEAGIPRRTVYGIWHGSLRTSPQIAAALLALRPLRVADALPTPIRQRDAVAASGWGPAQRRAALHDLDLRRHSAREVAEQLGVSPRTVQRWRAAQAATARGSSA
jgi:Homeodomain-like domain